MQGRKFHSHAKVNSQVSGKLWLNLRHPVAAQTCKTREREEKKQPHNLALLHNLNYFQACLLPTPAFRALASHLESIMSNTLCPSCTPAILSRFIPQSCRSLFFPPSFHLQRFMCVENALDRKEIWVKTNTSGKMRSHKDPVPNSVSNVALGRGFHGRGTLSVLRVHVVSNSILKASHVTKSRCSSARKTAIQ